MTVSGGDAVRVFQVDDGVTASLSGLTITGGSTSGDGGGLYNDGGIVTLTSVTLVSNLAAVVGGGIFNTRRGTITISPCTISGNSASSGGGIYNDDGTINMTDVTVSGNSASGQGGGVSNTGRGTITITTCSISGNTAAGGGGGVYNDGGTLTLAAVTVSRNSASGQGRRCVQHRSRHDHGYHLHVSGNSAAAGGGLYNSGTANLAACTIASNSAGVGGGIDNEAGGSATLEDTIVAANLGSGGSPSDIGGGNALGVTGTYDLIGTGGAGGITGGTGDIVLTSLANLGLASLGNYGGPTETMPLLPGSAALDAGTAIAGIPTDQRGLLPSGAVPDIGAFQSQGFILSAVAGSTPQLADTDTEFTNPLAVIATPINPIEPVAGGVVTFAVNPGREWRLGHPLRSDGDHRIQRNRRRDSHGQLDRRPLYSDRIDHRRHIDSRLQSHEPARTHVLGNRLAEHTLGHSDRHLLRHSGQRFASPRRTEPRNHT